MSYIGLWAGGFGDWVPAKVFRLSKTIRRGALDLLEDWLSSGRKMDRLQAQTGFNFAWGLGLHNLTDGCHLCSEDRNLRASNQLLTST